MKQTEIECDNCGKIRKKGIYYKIYLSDGYLETCSKKCAKKLYDDDFLNQTTKYILFNQLDDSQQEIMDDNETVLGVQFQHPNVVYHDFDNLYIADGTTFPYLPAKNLTFTLMANSVRVADCAF